MRRIIILLTVVALVVAIMLAGAVPAWAAKGAPGFGTSSHTFEDGSFQITGGGANAGGGQFRSNADGSSRVEGSAYN